MSWKISVFHKPHKRSKGKVVGVVAYDASTSTFIYENYKFLCRGVGCADDRPHFELSALQRKKYILDMKLLHKISDFFTYFCIVFFGSIGDRAAAAQEIIREHMELVAIKAKTLLSKRAADIEAAITQRKTGYTK